MFPKCSLQELVLGLARRVVDVTNKDSLEASLR
jgi:hypothetical protein